MIITAQVRRELREWNKEIRVARETYLLEQAHIKASTRVRVICRVKTCDNETRSQIGVCRDCQLTHQIAKAW